MFNIPEEYIGENQIAVPDSNLIFDPTTGEFREFIPEGDVVPNQYAWDIDAGGLAPLGADTPSSIIDPFLEIREEYRGGQPIRAETWQDAVRKSLEGFMRAEYGYQLSPFQEPAITDPIFNWDQDASTVDEGSQFRMGTLQELVNEIPDFYATGNAIRDLTTGGVIGMGDNADPLLGLQPSDKVLAFEDIPFEQVEQIVGQMPGEFYDLRGLAPLQSEIRQLNDEIDRTMDQITSFRREGDFAHANALVRQIQPVVNRRRELQRQVENQSLLNLNEARNQLADYNDFLFKLNIGEYAPPPEVIKATPESVLGRFFDTPAYRLAFGHDEGAIDPTASPHERFRFDPGYEFQQQEGLRQMMRGHAAQGLLESGRSIRDAQAYAQNLADQSYQRWLAQNQQLFNQWQNQLAGVAQQGAQFSGPGPALSTGSVLGQNELGSGANLANIAQSTAAGLAGNAQSNAGLLANLAAGTGSNIANALQNQGFFGGQAFLDTGAASANAVLQAAAIQAQMEAAQSASGGGGGKAGGALQGIGQIAGALGGGGFF